MKYTEICIFKNKQLVHFFCNFGSYSYEIVINYDSFLLQGRGFTVLRNQTPVYDIKGLITNM